MIGIIWASFFKAAITRKIQRKQHIQKIPGLTISSPKRNGQEGGGKMLWRNNESQEVVPPDKELAIFTGMATKTDFEVDVLCPIFVIKCKPPVTEAIITTSRWKRRTSRNGPLPIQTTYDLARPLVVICLLYGLYKRPVHESRIGTHVHPTKTTPTLAPTPPLSVSYLAIIGADLHRQGLYNRHHRETVRIATGYIPLNVLVDRIRWRIPKHTTDI